MQNPLSERSLKIMFSSLHQVIKSDQKLFLRMLKSWYTDRGPEEGFQRCFADGLSFVFGAG